MRINSRLLCFALLTHLMCATSAFADDSYYRKPCTVQAGDAKNFAALRDEGHSMTTLRHHIETTRPLEDQDALLNVLALVFTTLKAKTPNDMYETALFSCEGHGKDKSFGPMAEPSFSAPRGYLSEQEKASCAALHSRLQETINQITSHERRLDAMQSAVDASYARLKAMGSHPPDAMIDEHNKRASEAEQLSTEYTVLSETFNSDTDRYNEDCAGKAVR